LTEQAVSPDDEKEKRKAEKERLLHIMWAYVCGAITLISVVVGYEMTFIPLGFGVLGLVLVWTLVRQRERFHAPLAGAVNLGGILIWFSYNWPMLKSYIGG
jgi:hypothetical protein